MTPEKALEILNFDIYASPGEIGEAQKMAKEALGKLKEYQDLEEQGRLIKLPCKVGDAVYKFARDKHGNKTIVECEISSIEIFVTRMDMYVPWGNTLGAKVSVLDRMGKDVFYTREEAEAKLKELRESEQE